MVRADKVDSGRLQELRAAAERFGGEDLCEVADGRSFLWLFGSTLIEATLEEDGTILLQAYLVIGPSRGEVWTQRLARWEQRLEFGELAIDQDGDVVLIHRLPRLLANGSLPRELGRFCRTADLLDDQLVEQLGGERSIERFLRDVVHAITSEALGRSERASGDAPAPIDSV